MQRFEMLQIVMVVTNGRRGVGHSHGVPTYRLTLR